MSQHMLDQAVDHVQQCLSNLVSARDETPPGQKARIGHIITGLQTALSELRQAQTQVQDRMRFFETIVEEVREYAILTFDPDGIITSWNQGAELIFGYSAAEILGHAITIIFTPDDIVAGVPEQERATALCDGHAPDKRWHVRRDGTHFWADGTLTPIFDDGQLIGFSKILRDTTQRKELEDEREQIHQQLVYEQALMAAILAQLPSGLSVVEAPTGKIVLHNDEAVRVLGHPLLEAADYEGYAQYGALHEDGRPYQAEEYPTARALLRGDFVLQEDMLYRRGDGTLTHLSVNAAPVRTADGQLIAAVCIYHDMSERKHAEAELTRLYALEQEARAQAEEALQARDTFLAIAAHELRNPITGLMGYAQVLERRATKSQILSERDRRALRTITTQADRINRLIGAVLDVARLQTNHLTLHRQPFNLCELAERIVSEIEPTLEQHLLEYRCDPVLCLINGDPLRLEQVLYNLIQNAIKYSPQGGPILVEVTKQDSDALLSVTDQGIGIREVDRQRLFERFYRAENALDSPIAGMGIGLYVVHEIVSLHGGSIEVESGEGRGSTFRVRLPCLINRHAGT
jgi:PAS domain S-box-containing protein